MERFIAIIDRIAGPKNHADPFQKFRRRAFVILLLILALVSGIQALTAWLASQPSMTAGMMLTLCGLTLISLGWTRQAKNIEPSAMIILILLVCAGSFLELATGKSPNAPLVFWSPVILFGGFVFCGLKRGLLVAVSVMLSSWMIVKGSFLWQEPQVLPGSGDVNAYRQRLLVTVVLCHAFPLFLVGMYEKFFMMWHLEAQELLDTLEKRKERVFLGRLARLIVAEMEPELERLEAGYGELKIGGDPALVMEEVLKPLHRLAYVTRRYEPLSLGALAAIDHGLALEDFPGFIRRFTDFPRVLIQGQTTRRLVFHGGQAFFLLVFLCISLRELRERPGVHLQELILIPYADRSSVRRTPAISFPKPAREQKALAGGQRTLLSPIIGDFFFFFLLPDASAIHTFVWFGGHGGEIHDKNLCVRDGDSLISG